MGRHTTEMKMVSTSKLIPYVNNARTHSQEQVNKLRGSLREFGFINPVIIDADYNVIAGHGRLMAAKEEGIEEVPCVLVDYLSEAQKKAYTADMKTAVRKAGKSVKKDIQANAPKKTGAYSKSWSVKTTKETSDSLELTVYSPKKYQLAHLLEKGHAKRGGGRTKAMPHIAPAEENAVKELENDIKKALGGS